jgi:hypothetical protein
MSDTPNPAPKTRADVLPGYTLSEPSMFAHFDVEEELHRRLVATLVGGAARSTPEAIDQVTSKAMEVVSRRPLAALSQEYFSAIIGDRSLTAYLAWACARRNHPAASLSVIEKLITEENFWAVRNAVLELFGIISKNVDAVEPPKATESPSTSTESPKPSA